MFGLFRRKTPAADPATHDYSHRFWGHDYTVIRVIDDGQQLAVSGWGHGIEKGDYMLLQNGNSTTRYRVKEIDYKRDPDDMWHATMTFAPRPRPE